MASIEKYLQDRLDSHCEEWADEMRIEPEDRAEEIKSHKKLIEMIIWRYGEIIDIAYYMKIPKKALYRFGYTKKEINRIFSDLFAEDEYPY